MALREIQICEMVPIGWTCVDPIKGLEGDDAEPVCGYRFEQVCNIVSVPDVPDFPPSGGGGGSPGGSNNGGTMIDTVNVVVPAFMDTSGLDQSQILRLKETLANIKKYCLLVKLLNSFNSNSKIKFKTYPDNDSTTMAVYRSADSTIHITEMELEAFLRLGHEFFHGFQNQVVYGAEMKNYSKLTLNYLNGMEKDVIYQDGYINIEFETMIFMDLVIGYQSKEGSLKEIGQTYSPNGSLESTLSQTEYKNFVNEIRKNRNTPIYFESARFDSLYFENLKKWQKFTKLHYAESKIKLDLKPKALKKLAAIGLGC